MMLTPGQDTQLIANGYEPVPAIGKAAIAEGWQTGVIDSERIALFRKGYPHATNTGLRTGVLCAVDIDIRSPENSQQVATLADSILGPTPLRRFGSKGLILCYRTKTPSRKVSVLTDSETKIEILGTGLQFIAFGRHPETKRPFQWLGRDEFDEEATPLTIPLDALPEITTERIAAFARSCVELFGTLGYGAARIREAHQQEKIERASDAKEDDALNVDRAIAHLKNYVAQGQVAVIGQLGNDTIYETACLLRDRYYLSQAVIEELMLTHWYPHCVPNTLEDECRTIISHATSYMQNEPGARVVPPATEAFRAALDKLPDALPGGPKFKWSISGDDYTIDPARDVEMLVPTWYEKGIHTIHEGPAKTHKSRALLQDAICLANGLPIMGEAVTERCRTIYVNFENNPDEIKRRLTYIPHSLRNANSDPVPSIADIAIRDMYDSDEVLMLADRSGVTVTPWANDLLAEVAARPDHTFLILDGLLDAVIFRDNTMNDEVIARLVLRQLDRWCFQFNMSIQSIMHPARGAERQGIAGGSYANAWTAKPSFIQTYRAVRSPYAAPGKDRKDPTKPDDDTPRKDIWTKRRVQWRRNGESGATALLEFNRGGLRPHHPPQKRELLASAPEEKEFEDAEF